MPFAEEAGDFGEEDGSKVGTAVLHRPAHIASYKKGIHPERLLVLGLHIGGFGKGQNVGNFNIAQFVGAAHQPLGELDGYARPAANVEPAVGLYAAQSGIYIG